MKLLQYFMQYVSADDANSNGDLETIFSALVDYSFPREDFLAELCTYPYSVGAKEDIYEVLNYWTHTLQVRYPALNGLQLHSCISHDETNYCYTFSIAKHKELSATDTLDDTIIKAYKMSQHLSKKFRNGQFETVVKRFDYIDYLLIRESVSQQLANHELVSGRDLTRVLQSLVLRLGTES